MRAEPHALLVYGKGQFFLPHQDSEKDEAMAGTLVISLAYLLDHEYTQRGLGWDRLKGADAQRAALLRAAAEDAGCEACSRSPRSRKPGTQGRGGAAAVWISRSSSTQS